MTGSQGPARRRMVETPLVPVGTLILSGHDGDDAKPYQERAVRHVPPAEAWGLGAGVTSARLSKPRT
jgi:hypothetical protein